MRMINEDDKYNAVKMYLYREQFRYLWKLLHDHNIEDHIFLNGIRTKYHTMYTWERLDSQPSIEMARRIFEFFSKRDIKCDIKQLRFDVKSVKRQLRLYDIEDGNKTININGRIIIIQARQGEVVVVRTNRPVIN